MPYTVTTNSEPIAMHRVAYKGQSVTFIVTVDGVPDLADWVLSAKVFNNETGKELATATVTTALNVATFTFSVEVIQSLPVGTHTAKCFIQSPTASWVPLEGLWQIRL
jgi:hypothetical protein